MEEFFQLILALALISVFSIALPYFLAKRKGKDPVKFIILSLFFNVFVWGYLIFCKSDSQGGGEVRFFRSLTSINGISEKMAMSVMEKYPNRISVNQARISDLQEIPGIGENLAEAIKQKFS